jgi:hypothetical protein
VPSGNGRVVRVCGLEQGQELEHLGHGPLGLDEALGQRDGETDLLEPELVAGVAAQGHLDRGLVVGRAADDLAVVGEPDVAFGVGDGELDDDVRLEVLVEELFVLHEKVEQTDQNLIHFFRAFKNWHDVLLIKPVREGRARWSVPA